MSDRERLRIMTRRAFLLGGLELGIVGLLTGRLYQLQILNGEHYRTLAEENRINLRLLPPPRGLILDRMGTPFAGNQGNYRAVMVAEGAAGDVPGLLDRLTRLLALTAEDRKRIEHDLRSVRPFNPVLLRENLPWEQVAALELNTPDIPGVSIEKGEVRYYPLGEAAAHVIGHVGAVTDRDLEPTRKDPVLLLPGYKIGKNGMEKQKDSVLRGRAGFVQLEMNARGRVMRELGRQEGRIGAPLTLTLHAGLQEFAHHRLAEHPSASAVVMDVTNGDVLALASCPGFDPNMFAQGIPSTVWKSLNEDERAPLTNKAVSGLYAPGSTFKVVVALAALESGLVDADHAVSCPGHTDYGNHRFHCWKKEGHGRLTMLGGIYQSCDVYFYDLGRRIGIDRIHAMAVRLGLGNKLGLDLPHERGGLIPNQAWKRARLNAPWTGGENLVAAIGQGYITTTPLQLATVAARIAGGGQEVVPRLIRKVGDTPEQPPAAKSLGINPDHLALVVKGMESVTQAGGTAYGARITEAGYEMAGKTGTSQVRRISREERATGVIPNEQRPWRERDHALFIGFAPTHAPRYACAVVVEHGGGGSKAAAPIARDILLEAQKRDVAKAT